MMKLRLGLILTMAAAVPAKAVDVTPVWDVRFLGGQHFFDGEASSLKGNVSILAAPAMRFTERVSVIPTYLGTYQGTRDVEDFAGGGTPFQDSTSHGLNFKAIYSATTQLKLKATTGGNAMFLREIKGESWGDGLFDNRRIMGGVEAEYAFASEAGARVAYDYFTIGFPNYQSLESAQDPTLARELAGADVLDSKNHLITLGGWAPLPAKGRADLTLFFNRRGFDEQAVVSASGDLSGTDREDTMTSAEGSVSYPFGWAGMRLVGEVGLGYSMLSSNQNRYDARKTAFLQNYYDYAQMSVSQRLSAAFARTPLIVSAGFTWSERNYADRPVQSANGDYGTAKLNVEELTTTLAFAYPIDDRFSLRLAGTLGWSDANTDYDKVFAYNYRMANYLLGFSYAY